MAASQEIISPSAGPAAVLPGPVRRHIGSFLLGAFVLLLGAIYLFGGSGNRGEEQARPVSPSRPLTPRVGAVSQSGARQGRFQSADDPVRGRAGAAVTMVEFSDFECPFCRQQFPALQALMQQYGDKVLFQYRDFPLTDIHPHAQSAAEAAECAHDQGKFWEYHDLLFQGQQDLSRSALTRYALQLMLDLAAFNRCLDGGEKTQEVLQDFQEGVAAGVGGTPTFFINGEKYEGVFSFEELSEIIDTL